MSVYNTKTRQLDFKYDIGYATFAFNLVEDYKVIFVVRDNDLDYDFMLADLKDKSFERKFMKIPEKVTYFEISPDKSYLAAVFDDRSFRVYKMAVEKSKQANVKDENINSKAISVKPVLSRDSEILDSSEKAIRNNPRKEPDVHPLVLEVEPSVTEGFAPLEVNVAVLTSGNTDIIAHFISIDGKAELRKGPPPATVTTTFYTPGIHKMIIAVKDKAGNIVKRQILIKVKNKTFEDFKKEFGGN